MAKKNKIYVTTMYKYGDKCDRSYVEHAGLSKSKAIDFGLKEMDWRGSKYLPEVVEFDIFDSVPKKVVFKLGRKA